jgi:hypothetical protein
MDNNTAAKGGALTEVLTRALRTLRHSTTCVLNRRWLDKCTCMEGELMRDIADLLASGAVQADEMERKYRWAIDYANAQDRRVSEWMARANTAEAALAAAQAGGQGEAYSDMLRELCAYLGVGGYNSDGLMPPEVANQKIRDGIDNMIAVERQRAAAAGQGERVRAYAIYRQRPDENDGNEFFYAALWHNDTIPGEGERTVPGWFVPDAAAVEPAAPLTPHGPDIEQMLDADEEAAQRQPQDEREGGDQ